MLNAGQKYCRMLQREHSAIPLEHSAILSTFIKLPFAIKIFVLSIFEWPFYTGFTVKEFLSHTYLPFLLTLCIQKTYKQVLSANSDDPDKMPLMGLHCLLRLKKTIQGLLS